MNILLKINSGHGWLPGTLAAHLESCGHTVTVREEDTADGEYRVCFSSDVSAIERRDLLEQLDPIRPSVESMEAGSFDAEICLCLDSMTLRVLFAGTDEQAFKRLARALSLCGVNRWRHDRRSVSGGRRLYCQDAGAPEVQVMACLAAHVGYPVAITLCDWDEVTERFEDESFNMVMTLDAPSEEEKEAYARAIAVELHGDDAGLLEELATALEAAGFRNVQLSSSPVNTEEQDTLSVDVTALDMLGASRVRRDLLFVVREHLSKWGVDEGQYPLLVESEASDRLPGPLRISVALPVRAVMQGGRVPYGAITPARFSVRIKTDDPQGPEMESLLESLNELGLHSVLVEDAGYDAEAYRLGFSIRCPKSALSTKVEQKVRACLKRMLGQRLSEQSHQVVVRVQEEGLLLDASSANEITVFAPVKAAHEGTLLARMKDASPYDLTLHVRSSDDKAFWETLLNETIEEMGFGEYSTSRYADTDRTRQIRFGGASPLVIEELSQRLKELTGQRFTPKKQWGDSDMDVWVYLPEPDKVTSEGDSGKGDLPAVAPVDMTEWSCEAMGESNCLVPEPAGRPFIVREADILRVGEVELPLRAHPDAHLVPPLPMFGHYVIDRSSAYILESLAESVLLGEPVLLEGSTGTSKTSSILYLASLLGQPVVRINLNGHTDTAELVGRFQPEDGTADLPPPKALWPHTDCLTERGQRLVERAIEEGRDFTVEERQLLKAAEGWPSRPWQWHDGLVPMAMRRGWWVILDEVNLAEPQVVERLNSVLEMPSSLVLTEYDGSMLEAAAGFHLFATMNPEEYAGRAALSPAFLDRWLCFLRVEGPDEVDILNTLRRWVLGKSPQVVLHGVAWDAEEVAPIFRHVAEMSDVEAFLTALAAFHQGMVAEQDNGMEGSRRRLLAALRYLDGALARGLPAEVTVARLVRRYYLHGDMDDLSAKQLAEATGLDRFVTGGDGV